MTTSTKFVVVTRDVDGSSRRSFKTREGARKRFEAMLGYPVANAIAEAFYQRAERGEALPEWESLTRLSGVSMFGTAVSFHAEEV
jgi:hypothetical protein